MQLRNENPDTERRDIRVRRGEARREEGSTLLLSLLILASLSIIASTMILTAMGDRNLSKYDRHSLMALGAAETGIAFAKRAIVSVTAPMTDYDADGRPDFTITDSLSWGAYEAVAEASDIKGIGITAYQSNGFSIISEGRFLGATRRVKAEIVHDSFLKFARFVSVNNLNYACNAVLTGDVYTGGNLGVPCGCASTQRAEFLEGAFAVGDIPNAGCGVFHRGYVTDADEIDLENSFDWTDTRDKARGLGADPSCEGDGEVGIYMDLGSAIDPLGLAGQAAPFTNVLDFTRFDFMNDTLEPPDTVVTYDGNPVINPTSAATMRRNEFNGIVFFEGQAHVRGEIDGVSGFTMTVFGTSQVIVEGSIIAGHDGFDPVTRDPDGSGDPVNVGLVAEDYVGMGASTPKVLQVDAALFSRSNNWIAMGNTGTHPTSVGPLDLDLDGIIGETPFNGDPNPGSGWDEGNIDSDTWVLNITGPIITKYGGSAWPWNDGGVLASADGPTRRYNYDLDITEFPPPCFPVPLNLWKDVSWTELFDVRNDLADNLPN